VRSETVRPGGALLPAFNCGRAGWAALKLLLALVSLGARPVMAQQEAVVTFDIPAQPLASALDAYSAATGLVAVYNGRLAAGRTSNAVRGTFVPGPALRLLLKDSGLVAEHTTAGAFVVVSAPDNPALTRTPAAIALAALSAQDARERRYSAMLQQGVNNALCGKPLTMPGAYRAALSLWVGADGVVTRVRLLSSTGDVQRDAAIVAGASALALGEPPPARMAQPFTMVLLPRSSGGVVVCSPAEGRGHG
jgi:hypothetical protein